MTEPELPTAAVPAQAMNTAHPESASASSSAAQGMKRANSSTPLLEDGGIGYTHTQESIYELDRKLSDIEAELKAMNITFDGLTKTFDELNEKSQALPAVDFFFSTVFSFLFINFSLYISLD